uniref:Cellulose synthase-like protein G3 n=1 Tax=Rhizophora mucronata TaxID=61149 RepID=A0A2P2KHR8_RHIMU
MRLGIESPVRSLLSVESNSTSITVGCSCRVNLSVHLSKILRFDFPVMYSSSIFPLSRTCSTLTFMPSYIILIFSISGDQD